MKTKAALLTKTGSPLEIQTLDLAPPQTGEVLIQVAATGVCHSDWHVVTGDTQHPLPVVLGHEGAGVVAEVGTGVKNLSVGDHVALNWAPYCGECFYCSHAQTGLCDTFIKPLWAGTMLDGTTRFSLNSKPVYQYSGLGCFAEHTVVPESCCVVMPKEVPFEITALIGCAVTTGVGAVLNTAKVTKNSSVAVFGCGGVGLSVLLGAKLAGAKTIFAIDRSESKCKLAKKLGATDAFVADENVLEAIRSKTDGRGADFVFEAVGLPSVQEQCFQAARPGGTVVLAGLAPMDSSTNFPGSLITRQEKKILGSYYGSANIQQDFPRFAHLFQQGELPIDRLISQTYALEDINTAFIAMLSGDIARGVVLF